MGIFDKIKKKYNIKAWDNVPREVYGVPRGLTIPKRKKHKDKEKYPNNSNNK